MKHNCWHVDYFDTQAGETAVGKSEESGWFCLLQPPTPILERTCHSHRRCCCPRQCCSSANTGMTSRTKNPQCHIVPLQKAVAQNKTKPHFKAAHMCVMRKTRREVCREPFESEKIFRSRNFYFTTLQQGSLRTTSTPDYSALLSARYAWRFSDSRQHVDSKDTCEARGT